jgi:hypothetical protein
VAIDTGGWADEQGQVRPWRIIKQIMTEGEMTRYRNFLLKDELLYLKTFRFVQEFDRPCVAAIGERRYVVDSQLTHGRTPRVIQDFGENLTAVLLVKDGQTDYPLREDV